MLNFSEDEEDVYVDVVGDFEDEEDIEYEEVASLMPNGWCIAW